MKFGIFVDKTISEEFPCIVSLTSKFHLCFFGGGERERASSSSSLGGEIREGGRKEREKGGGACNKPGAGFDNRFGGEFNAVEKKSTWTKQKRGK